MYCIRLCLSCILTGMLNSRVLHRHWYMLQASDYFLSQESSDVVTCSKWLLSVVELHRYVS